MYVCVYFFIHFEFGITHGIYAQLHGSECDNGMKIRGVGGGGQ